jgi:hypothetical protein
MWLPKRSLNCRSCWGVSRPLRTIEIFSQGGREDGRTSKGESRLLAPPPANRHLLNPRRKYSLIRSSESKNAFSPPSDLPSSRPPCENLGGARREANGTTAARGMPRGEAEGRSAASAGKLRIGSPRWVESFEAAELQPHEQSSESGWVFPALGLCAWSGVAVVPKCAQGAVNLASRAVDAAERTMLS